MLSLTPRTAKIGNAINSRAELHGDESVTALDIPLSGLMLDRDELNDLLNEPYAHDALFNSRKAQSAHAAEPMFPQLLPFGLAEKVEGATVTIVHGVERKVVRLGNAKVAKIRLVPKVGGFTEMNCVVQSTPNIDGDLAELLDRLNDTVEITIEAAQHGAQQDLLKSAEPEIHHERDENGNMTSDAQLAALGRAADQWEAEDAASPSTDEMIAEIVTRNADDTNDAEAGFSTEAEQPEGAIEPEEGSPTATEWPDELPAAAPAQPARRNRRRAFAQ